ncbi:MAG: YraN family protein [bacterium]|nr:YraN family protein [bacterium]
MQVKSQNKSFGKRGEQIASELLIGNGYKIIDKNFSGRFGEIDIIAIDGQTLVFVEVKTRKNRRFGLPQEAVTRSKLGKIKKTAEYYSLLHPELPKKLRIDVVALILNDGILEYSKIIKVY